MTESTVSTTSKSVPMSSLVTLAVVGGVDSISYMIVAPSLSFYVLECGGTLEQYGFILSTFSLASFFAKPFLGWWIDANGQKFRVPYFVSIATAIVGSLLYFLASLYKSTPKIAIAIIFIGRFLGGVGAANQAIGFAYLAATVPHEKQTRTNSMLSLVRILGMAAGPAFNLFLTDIDGQFSFGETTFDLDPLNSVGLMMAALNAVALVTLYVLLGEPPDKPAKDKMPQRASILGEEGPEILRVLKATMKLDILLPVYTIFVINSAFQIIETGFAPAARDALGWGPVETSAVLGSTSVVIFIFMLFVMVLSSKKVKDSIIMSIGCMAWIVGGTLMYLLWARNAKVWHFVLPVVFCASGFPFIAPSNRSEFTKAVDAIPLLQNKQGMMQAVLSMSASVAGFVAPSLIASFILRRPEEVEASSDQRELNAWALYIPVLTGLIIVGLYVSSRHEDKRRIEREESLGDTSEEARLLAGRHHGGRSYSAVVVQQALDHRTVVDRRTSVQVPGMGIPLMMTASEQERANEMYKAMQDIDWSEFVDEERE